MKYIFEPDCFTLHNNIHTLRLVNKLVSVNPGGGGVPGHPEAGVPLIRNTEVPGAEHTHCWKRRKRSSQHRL